MSKIKKPSKKIIIAIVILILIAGAAYFYFNKKNSQTNPTPSGEYINYNPPTEQEKKEADERKKNLGNNQNSQANTITQGQKKSVTPIITSAQQTDRGLETYVYIPGIFEDGGQCKLNATKGSKTISVTSSAFANATTTDCQPLIVNRASFPEAGTWQIIVFYESQTASGSSQTNNINIR